LPILTATLAAQTSGKSAVPSGFSARSLRRNASVAYRKLHSSGIAGGLVKAASVPPKAEVLTGKLKVLTGNLKVQTVELTALTVGVCAANSKGKIRHGRRIAPSGINAVQRRIARALNRTRSQMAF
jgi:hypothetical protein